MNYPFLSTYRSPFASKASEEQSLQLLQLRSVFSLVASAVRPAPDPAVAAGHCWSLGRGLGESQAPNIKAPHKWSHFMVPMMWKFREIPGKNLVSKGVPPFCIGCSWIFCCKTIFILGEIWVSIATWEIFPSMTSPLRWELDCGSTIPKRPLGQSFGKCQIYSNLTTRSQRDRSEFAQMGVKLQISHS